MYRSGYRRLFFEGASDNFWKYRVEGVTFTNKTKEVLAYRLQQILILGQT
jgi:uncharacterized protein YfdQ (DUF2303 family)